MRKKLIAAIIVILFLIAAAVGVIIYMENKPGETTDTESTSTESEIHETEETVGLSLPTEDPDEVTPADSFEEDDDVPPAVTGGSENSSETESPDANETPQDIF